MVVVFFEEHAWQGWQRRTFFVWRCCLRLFRRKMMVLNLCEETVSCDHEQGSTVKQKRWHDFSRISGQNGLSLRPLSHSRQSAPAPEWHRVISIISQGETRKREENHRTQEVVGGRISTKIFRRLSHKRVRSMWQRVNLRHTNNNVSLNLNLWILQTWLDRKGAKLDRALIHNRMFWTNLSDLKERNWTAIFCSADSWQCSWLHVRRSVEVPKKLYERKTTLIARAWESQLLQFASMMSHLISDWLRILRLRNGIQSFNCRDIRWKHPKQSQNSGQRWSLRWACLFRKRGRLHFANPTPIHPYRRYVFLHK